jgi:hypothetical protein
LGAAAIGGCTDRGYGYSGVSVGYNAAWGDPYWGWYGDYYYPGTGVYVYDRNHRRHAWNDTQRGYWEGRSRQLARGSRLAQQLARFPRERRRPGRPSLGRPLGGRRRISPARRTEAPARHAG